MAHYLDPKNDLTFKRVFGEHKHLCMSLLNSMLPLEKPIVALEYQTGELIPELADVLRHTIVDVRCTDLDGRQFIVEMQLFWSDSFKKRVLLNASKAYVKQLDKAEKFRLLQPVFALNFVNETFENAPEMKEEYFHHYKIVNIKDTGKQIEGLEFVFIELPKFKPQNKAEKKLHELWLRFLTEIDEQTGEIPHELLENEYLSEAVSYMERGAYSKEELATYDKFKDAIMTELSVIDDAMTKGEAIGLTKGEAIGLEKGRVEGLEKGRAEGEAQTLERIVIDSKNNGLSLEQIQSITKLSIKQITEMLLNT